MYKGGIKVICLGQITECLRESTWHTPNWKQTSKAGMGRAGTEPFPSPLACCS